MTTRVCTQKEKNMTAVCAYKHNKGLYAGKKGYRLFTQEKTTQFCTHETRVTGWTRVALNQNMHENVTA